jgi:hypothetical protein
MTFFQIAVMSAAYATLFAAVIYFTNAPWRRVVGALVGGVAASCLGMAAIISGESIGVWWVSLPATPGVQALFFAGLAISLSPIYLVTWRVVRRFGWRGLALCLVIVGVIGPPRDYFYASVYPEWMIFAKGVGPVIADAVTYIGCVALGHVVMWLVSGAARGGGLARPPAAATVQV